MRLIFTAMENLLENQVCIGVVGKVGKSSDPLEILSVVLPVYVIHFHTMLK